MSEIRPRAAGRLLSFRRLLLTRSGHSQFAEKRRSEGAEERIIRKLKRFLDRNIIGPFFLIAGTIGTVFALYGVFTAGTVTVNGQEMDDLILLILFPCIPAACAVGGYFLTFHRD